MVTAEGSLILAGACVEKVIQRVQVDHTVRTLTVCSATYAAGFHVVCVAGSVEGRARYYFMIGSVDSFERKLDEAQRELGLTTASHVPVKYTHEVRRHWLYCLFVLGNSVLEQQCGGRGCGTMCCSRGVVHCVAVQQLFHAAPLLCRGRVVVVRQLNGFAMCFLQVSIGTTLLEFLPTLLFIGWAYWLISRQMRNMPGGFGPGEVSMWRICQLGAQGRRVRSGQRCSCFSFVIAQRRVSDVSLHLSLLLRRWSPQPHGGWQERRPWRRWRLLWHGQGQCDQCG